MRVAKYAEVPWTRTIGSRGSGDYNVAHQDETLPEEKKPGGRQKTLFRGTKGAPGNFEMVVLRTVRTEAVRHYPRHHHDFDQLRMTLVGNPQWTPGNVTPEGGVIYMAAGTHYGPYDRQEGEEQLHIQFAGANGALFVDYDSLKAARDALAKKGSFEKGFYTWVDEQGKRHNKDGHEANAEYAKGKPVDYPPPRYTTPINMDPESFNWLDVQSGVRFKELARFTERETRVAMIRLDGQASYKISAQDQTTLLFVKAGTGTADGQAIEERDGMMLEPGEEGEISTTDHLEVLLLALPKLAEAKTTGGVGEPALASA